MHSTEVGFCGLSKQMQEMNTESLPASLESYSPTERRSCGKGGTRPPQPCTAVQKQALKPVDFSYVNSQTPTKMDSKSPFCQVEPLPYCLFSEASMSGRQSTRTIGVKSFTKINKCSQNVLIYDSSLCRLLARGKFKGLVLLHPFEIK